MTDLSLSRLSMPDDYPVGTFVYGTLRTGQRLDGMISADVERTPASTRARLWHVDSYGSFPVMTVTDAETGDTVRGELLDVHPAEIATVTQMELGAGYDLERIVLDDGRTAFAFVWPHPDRGDRIESGDWLRRKEQRSTWPPRR